MFCAQEARDEEEGVEFARDIGGDSRDSEFGGLHDLVVQRGVCQVFFCSRWVSFVLELRKILVISHFNPIKPTAAIEQSLKLDRILAAHYRYYIREMRIIAYAQLLESYRSVTIESMAHSFGVSEEFIDSDLSRFIASGRLNAVIDKVGGIVETNRPDAKNAQYQAAIKQGDALLNRVQKLASYVAV